MAEDVHCVGLSILSGSHMELVPAVLDGLREAGLERRAGDRRRDHPRLRRAGACAELGVAAVFTPKDFGLTEIMGGIVDVIRRANGLALTSEVTAAQSETQLAVTRSCGKVRLPS